MNDAAGALIFQSSGRALRSALRSSSREGLGRDLPRHAR